MSLICTLIVFGLAGWGYTKPILPLPYQLVYLNPSPVGYHLQAQPAPVISNRVTEDSVSESEEEDNKGYDVTQFHSEDERGRIVYGFQSPDQVRMEARDPDGTVRGSYSYVDPYGNIVKMQYWDEGNGIHMAGNNLPVAVHQVPEYTPEVRAAREEHFRLYNAALAALKAAGLDDDPESESPAVDDSPKPAIEDVKEEEEAPPSDDTVIVENESAEREPIPDFQKTPYVPHGLFDSQQIEDNDDEESIAVDNPELIKIDWGREGKSNKDASVDKPEMEVSSSSQVDSRSDTTDLGSVDDVKIVLTPEDEKLKLDLVALKSEESSEERSSQESKEDSREVKEEVEKPMIKEIVKENPKIEPTLNKEVLPVDDAGSSDENASGNRGFFYQFFHLLPQPVERVDDSISDSEPAAVRESRTISSNVPPQDPQRTLLVIPVYGAPNSN